MIPWWSPCDCPCAVGFVYKMFQPGFGELTSAQITLPEDDPTWPTTNCCARELPYHQLHARTNLFKLAGRVYHTDGSGLDFDGGDHPPLYDSPPPPYTTWEGWSSWVLIDDLGRVYWQKHDPPGPPFNNTGTTHHVYLYRYDPSIGLPDEPLAHSLIYTAGPFNYPQGGGRFVYGWADARGDRLLVLNIGELSATFDAQGYPISDGIDHLLMIDTTAGTVLWDRTIDSGWGADLTTRIGSVKIGQDGNVYALVGAMAARYRAFMPPPPNSSLLAGFLKLSPTTGETLGGYGRFVGAPDFYDTAVHRISCFSGFDVDGSGNVALGIAAYRGRGIVKLAPSGGPEITDGHTDPDAYVALGYTESWFVHDSSGSPPWGSLYDPPSISLGIQVKTSPGFPCHDTINGGVYYKGYVDNCLHYADIADVNVWSRLWAVTDPVALIPRAPADMQRDDAGRIHTATVFNFVQEPPGDLGCPAGLCLATIYSEESDSLIEIGIAELDGNGVDGTGGVWVGSTVVAAAAFGCTGDGTPFYLFLRLFYDAPSSQWLLRLSNSFNDNTADLPAVFDPDTGAGTADGEMTFCSTIIGNEPIVKHILVNLHGCSDNPDGPVVETECCGSDAVPRTLPVTRHGLFPGFDSLVYTLYDDGSGGTWDSWQGTVSGEGCDTSVVLLCRPCTGGDCEGGGEGSFFTWYLSLNGSAFFLLPGVTCSQFAATVSLDPWPVSGGIYILPCTTLVIGNDEGSIEDGPATLDCDVEFVPNDFPALVHSGSGPLTRTSCAGWSGVIEVSGASGTFNIFVSLLWSAGVWTMTTSKDADEWWSSTKTVNCDAVSVSESGAVTVNGFPGQGTVTITEPA